MLVSRLQPNFLDKLYALIVIVFTQNKLSCIKTTLRIGYLLLYGGRRGGQTINMICVQYLEFFRTLFIVFALLISKI